VRGLTSEPAGRLRCCYAQTFCKPGGCGFCPVTFQDCASKDSPVDQVFFQLCPSVLETHDLQHSTHVALGAQQIHAIRDRLLARVGFDWLSSGGAVLGGSGRDFGQNDFLSPPRIESAFLAMSRIFLAVWATSLEVPSIASHRSKE
jgi:hypothetical protein